MAYVLILGAGSDVAIACAHKFAENGYDLYLAGRNLRTIDAHASDIQIRYSVKAKTIAFDALAFETHPVIYEALYPRPDITICVFGFMGQQEVSEQNWADCKKVIDSNYTGAVSMINCVANNYEASKKGVIVGVSSSAGDRGRRKNYIYGSAKAGLTAYLSGLRSRMSLSDVHVVTVKPGFIDTRMTEGLKLPKAITAKPEQVATAIFMAVKKRKNVVYVLPVWRLIMFLIKVMPEKIFKKLNF